MELPEPTARPLAEAVDEVEREMNVRARCFSRWVQEGRMTRTDAIDRRDRMISAFDALKKLQDLGEAAEEAAS